MRICSLGKKQAVRYPPLAGVGVLSGLNLEKMHENACKGFPQGQRKLSVISECPFSGVRPDID